MDIERVFEQVAPAIVGVQAGPGLGSGFFVDRRGLVVTNRHVVGCEPEVVLSLSDTTEVRGKVVRSIRSLDLAFILADLDKDCTAVELAVPETIKVGQEVIAIGHPRGLANTVTRGIVSSLGRLINGTKYLQTDAAINPGNSGGPLINERSEVVGVSTMILNNAHGIGFALPADPLRTAVSGVLAQWAELSKLRYCNICGASNAPDQKYCGTCGDGFSGRPVEFDRLQRSQTQMVAAAGPPKEWTCTACKNTGTTVVRYCPRCGATL